MMYKVQLLKSGIMPFWYTLLDHAFVYLLCTAALIDLTSCNILFTDIPILYRSIMLVCCTDQLLCFAA